MPTEFQKRKLALAFYKYDTSKDGFVEASDLELQGQKVADLLGVKQDDAERDRIISAYRLVWEAYFKPGDRDGDNKITLEEYIKGIEPYYSNDGKDNSALEVNKVVFDSIDLDGSGQIDSAEYGVFLRSLGISKEEADFAFQKIDTDGNGYISRDEFAKNLADYFLSDDPQDPANWFYGSF
ncbi:MAG: EF-hand domain-containing protein [Cyanobacteriota bacterium]|nr:EF-hand domain-containing protein [Cyanobacteriota bacterium]